MRSNGSKNVSGGFRGAHVGEVSLNLLTLASEKDLFCWSLYCTERRARTWVRDRSKCRSLESLLRSNRSISVSEGYRVAFGGGVSIDLSKISSDPLCSPFKWSNVPTSRPSKGSREAYGCGVVGVVLLC